MSSLRLFVLGGVLIALILLVAGCTQQQGNVIKSESTTSTLTPVPPGEPAGQSLIPKAVPMESWEKVNLETTKGNITIALDPDMPVTAGNFKSLVSKGFYNGVIFHRVMDGFMIQSGDPTGTGRGGPGYVIKDEFTPGNRNDRGTISMANAGPNTGGSQFFINLVNNNYLDRKHPVFGKVVEGMDVVDTIGKVPTNGNSGGNRPLQNVTIIRAAMV